MLALCTWVNCTFWEEGTKQEGTSKRLLLE